MTRNEIISNTEHLPHATWRLIRSEPGHGSWNMAVDEAILQAIGRDEVPPTLRLYAWQPACLSLGYAQPGSDVDSALLKQHGWDLVRRPTGGRAILHTDELTYSVTGPQKEPRLAGSVLESYRTLSQALLLALHLLDIPAQAMEKPLVLNPSMSNGNEKNGEVNPVCFEVPSNYEITIHGKKIVGSAQARRKQGVLQHGSLPLYGDLTRITQALVFPDTASRKLAAERLLARATTAEAILGQPLAWEAAAEAFIKAFSQALNLDLQPGELTPKEQQEAEALQESKYAHSQWTERV
jgi:lipoyl(octanoyl) transferase